MYLILTNAAKWLYWLLVFNDSGFINKFSIGLLNRDANRLTHTSTKKIKITLNMSEKKMKFR